MNILYIGVFVKKYKLSQEDYFFFPERAEHVLSTQTVSAFQPNSVSES